MKKSLKASALLVAGVFALSGCGSSDESAAADSPASASPTPTLAVGEEQYTADELETALTAVKTAQGLTGNVQNDALLRPELKDAALSEITATPEQCTILVSSLFDKKIADGNLATLELDDTDILMLVSYEDASVLQKQAEDSDQLIEDCAEFQMELNGTPITGTVEGIDASSEAPTTEGYRTLITRANGEGTAIQVTALSGTLSLNATLFDPADEAAAVANAEKAINAVLAELEKK